MEDELPSFGLQAAASEFPHLEYFWVFRDLLED
jgi:hypothetical protein